MPGHDVLKIELSGLGAESGFGVTPGNRSPSRRVSRNVGKLNRRPFHMNSIIYIVGLVVVVLVVLGFFGLR